MHSTHRYVPGVRHLSNTHLSVVCNRIGYIAYTFPTYVVCNIRSLTLTEDNVYSDRYSINVGIQYTPRDIVCTAPTMHKPYYVYKCIPV